ncbi:tropomyosin-1, isoforms 33/34-like [Oenanthe melanoleuca]|uniref:tropomyosin-1, isoforms 33/34-like n=1 Tax=Oenanthe melanoleuca TaxID=2939378 RepID=UPI0024C1C8BA|nr:tropomyosin-1, isoforms 33/34-like [Oenanthe melanoleuca]
MRAAARGRDRASLPPGPQPEPGPAARLPPCPAVRAARPRGSGARRPSGVCLRWLPWDRGTTAASHAASVRPSVRPSIHPRIHPCVGGGSCVCVTDREARTARGQPLARSPPGPRRRAPAAAAAPPSPEPSPVGTASAAALLVLLLLPPGGAFIF